ncbi:MAG TPA: hypothetical protein DCZ92_12415 [Elusimicrobia bacterium]|nr:MAG: hypothetical protein A2016_02040 [Elusimicrobia bacterium GWF2_62_30]HBA61592.1 hypothetical protein [Elusimicrobiota bacterium]
MLKLLHAADLHLSSGPEKEYGLEVLREIISLANQKQADFVLFCGDLFDSFKDLKSGKLLDAVKEEAQRLHNNGRILYIPGNHESLGMGEQDKFSNFNFGRIELMADPSSEFGGRVLELPAADIVCVPHAQDYSGYRKWPLPPKRAGTARVLMMHGTSSAVYRGPDPEEGGAGVIPDSLFEWLGTDYAALGHVHSARESRIGGTLAVYCGSARVWRRREEGPRKAVYFEIKDGEIAGKEDLLLQSAGQYRAFTLPLDPDAGVPPAAMRGLLEKLSSPERDYVVVSLSGLVEDANALSATERALEDVLRAKSPRKLEILSGEVENYGGAASNELAKQFLARLDAVKPPAGSPETELWFAARRQGLAALTDRELE